MEVPRSTRRFLLGIILVINLELTLQDDSIVEAVKNTCRESFKITNITNTSVKVSWSCPDCLPLPFTVFLAANDDDKYCDAESPCALKFSGVFDGTCALHINNLCPGHLYNVRLSQSGIVLVRRNVSTTPGKPNSPTDLQADVRVNSILLSWTNPTCPKNYKFKNTIIYWKGEDEGNSDEYQLNSDVNITPLLNLEPSTLHSFRVKSCLENYSELCATSYAKTVKTQIGVPEAPTVQLESRGSEEITISWIVRKLHGKLKTYLVNCGNNITPIETLNTRFTCQDFVPYTSYEISVAAVNIDENNSTESHGPWSDILKVHTEVASPGAVDDLAAETIQDSINVTWNRPSSPYGPIDYYKVILFQGENLVRESRVNETSYEFSRLLPYITYRLVVYAVNVREDGTHLEGKSAEKEIRTEASEPGPCLNFTADTDSASSIRLMWAKPNQKNGPIDGYTLVFAEEKDFPSNSKSQVSDGRRLELLLTGLQPYKYYYIEISAFNKVGKVIKSGPISSISARTAPNAPSYLKSVGIRTLGSDKVEVTWDERNRSLGPVDGYIVSYRKKTGRLDGVVEIGPNQNSAAIDKLLADTVYEFWVQAYNVFKGKKQTSMSSETKETKTFTGRPSEVTKLIVYSALSSSLVLAWKPPDAGARNGPIGGYFLQINNGTPKEVEKISSSYEPRTVVRDLEHYTEYTFSVWAYNVDTSWETDKIHGLPSTIIGRTSVDLPGPPTSLQAIDLNETRAQFQWMPPLDNQPSASIVFYTLNLVDVLSNVTLESRMAQHSDEAIYFNNLQAFTDYRIEASASILLRSHFYFQGAWAKVVFRTKPSLPGPPASLKVVDLNENTVRVQWKPPLLTHADSIAFYTITITNIKYNFTLETKYIKLSNEAVFFHGLEAYVNYRIKVSASIILRGEYHFNGKSAEQNIRTKPLCAAIKGKGTPEGTEKKPDIFNQGIDHSLKLRNEL